MHDGRKGTAIAKEKKTNISNIVEGHKLNTDACKYTQD